jgi:hypothetical protein
MKLTTVATVAIVVIVACASNASYAQPLKDGIYKMSYEPDDGTRRASRDDGAAGDVYLAQRIGDDFGKAVMRSTANDNSKFRIDLESAGPIPEGADIGHLALVIDGKCLPTWGHSNRRDDGRIDLSTSVQGLERAQTIATRLGIDPQVRVDPGHRLLTRFEPLKAQFVIGEPVELRMIVRNVGDIPVRFQVGGQQRGPRDNQFRFLALHGDGSGRAVPDTGDPMHMGGLCQYKTLKPGETFVMDNISLDRWFKFDAPDRYRVTGIYEIQMYELTKHDTLTRDIIWDDLLVGECAVRIVEQAKKEE